MKHLTFGVVLGLVVIATTPTACAKQEAQSAENFITDITNSVCTPLEQQTSNVYVDFTCTIAESVEGLITVLTGTQATVTIPPLQVTVHVPKAQAAAFATEHTAAAVTARKAARGK
jgi:hypothetical protein